MAFKRKTPHLRFNPARVASTLNARNPKRYERTVTLTVGGKKHRTVVHDAAKLRSDVEKYRKKAAMKKGRALAKEAKAQASASRKGSGGSGLQRLAVTGGLLAAGRMAARKLSGMLNKTNKLGSYRF